MAVLVYKGINTAGKNVSGVIEAESEKAGRLKLRQMGVFPTTINTEGKSGGGGLSLNMEVDFNKYLQRVKAKDIALFTRQLSTLIQANVPLVDALAAVVDSTENPKLRIIISDLKEKVTEGSTLADSLVNHKKIFSNLYVNMIKAGESSGALDVVLDRLAFFTEKQAQLRSKIMGALMYPIIMAIVGFGLVGFMIVYVVPKVTKIFDDVEATLPLPTQILIWLSDVLQNYWYLVILGAGLMIYLIRRYVNTPGGRARYDRLSLKMPIFGNLFRLVAIARFSRTLSTLMSSGVQLLNALDIVKNIVENTLLTDAIEECKVRVREGENLAEPLKRSGQFPPMVTHMIAIGEKTGSLETMLERIAEAYETEVDTAVGTLTTLLEPLMILLMGGIVSFLVMSILLPILQLNQLGA
jgi:general secretion pathway protein F